jgi:orotate phosphoribosyltransferase
MLKQMQVLDLYRQQNAYLEGHFLLASGMHTPTFLQSTRVFQYPPHAEAIGCALACLFADVTAEHEIDFVIGPAMGGVVLAHAVARALGVRALFAEKDDRGGMSVRSAFEICAGERFLAVEDVITTGASLKKAIAAAERHGAVCCGVGCVIDRGLSEFSGLRSLARLEFPTYAPDECPLCREGVPLEEV